jgi:hypothetical protein
MVHGWSPLNESDNHVSMNSVNCGSVLTVSRECETTHLCDSLPKQWEHGMGHGRGGSDGLGGERDDENGLTLGIVIAMTTGRP